MISYNHGSQDIVLEIRERLMKNGFKVSIMVSLHVRIWITQKVLCLQHLLSDHIFNLHNLAPIIHRSQLQLQTRVQSSKHFKVVCFCIKS